MLKSSYKPMTTQLHYGNDMEGLITEARKKIKDDIRNHKQSFLIIIPRKLERN